MIRSIQVLGGGDPPTGRGALLRVPLFNRKIVIQGRAGARPYLNRCE
jgi:hypothetical protein